MSRMHGGPDSLGIPVWDFSTNTNACGPCPLVVEAIQSADIRHYPDPSYQALRQALAGFHQVDTERIVLGASASELIMRLTACMASTGARRVWLPAMAYGEYAHAAQVWGLSQISEPAQAELCWVCEPSSPLGGTESQLRTVMQQKAMVVLDRAYEPLRLSGTSSVQDDENNRIWQLWSPNKALGMTGIRGAYLIAPVEAAPMTQLLERHAPSWPLGAHAVSMLHAWTRPQVQIWLAESLETLRTWKAEQLASLKRWPCLASEANFFCMQATLNVDFLRERGIKLRDATSFGLPGYWRLSVQAPKAQQALIDALEAGGAV